MQSSQLYFSESYASNSSGEHSGLLHPQTTVAELGRWALAEPSIEKLFQQAVSVIAATLKVEYIRIWQVQSDRQSLRLVASNYLPVSESFEEITVITTPQMRDFLALPSPILKIDAIQTPSQQIPIPPPSDSKWGAFLSILGQEQLLGILEVHRVDHEPFELDEIYFLQSIVNILATAILRQRSEAKIKTQSKVLEDLATGASLPQVLSSLCELLEQELPSAYCSILLADPQNQCLRSGAAPSLPVAYSQGVDGLMIGERCGSCGTAAYRGEAVFVNDIATDPLWAEFRDFALGHGIHACWSAPFRSTTGDVLGTFALSHRFACTPTPYHHELMTTAVHLASIAVESCRRAEAVHQLNLELDQKVAIRTHELSETLQQLQKTQCQLIQAEKMSALGQMVAGVAHEINNPITFIAGNLDYVEQYSQVMWNLLEIYQKEYPQPTQPISEAIASADLDFVKVDFLRILKSFRLGSDRITNIVLGLRNFARLDESEKKFVNVHEGIENTLMIVNHRLQQLNVGRTVVQIEKNYGNLPLVNCYANQINQVIMNLLINAIDTLEEKLGQFNHDFLPKIRISTEVADAQFIRISITDNGLGMSDAVQAKVFGPFYTTKPIGKGTGLGLSISYQIITEQHCGELICNSVEGEGTEFIIVIPIT